MSECINNGWLEKEINKTELNMSLEDAYKWIKESYLHHKTERNAVFTPKAELIALMCINTIADGCVKKSAVLQMLHEAYADGVMDTKDGCKALYKRLNDLPEATVKHGEWVERAYGRKQCTCCGKCEDVATDICPNCNAVMSNPKQ